MNILADHICSVVSNADNQALESLQLPMDSPLLHSIQKSPFLNPKGSKLKSAPPVLKIIPHTGGYQGYAYPVNKTLSSVTTKITVGKDDGEERDALMLYDNGILLMRKILSSHHSTGSSNGHTGSNTGHDHIEHPLIALLLYGKAELYRLRGDLDHSIATIQACLTMCRHIYSLSHPSVAQCLVTLGDVFRGDHKYLEAKAMYDKAQDIFSQCFVGVYSTSHSDSGSTTVDNAYVTEVYGCMAMLLHEHGRYDDAVALYQKVLLNRRYGILMYSFILQLCLTCTYSYAYAESYSNVIIHC